MSPLTEAQICNISKGTGLAEVLIQWKLIVWNECIVSNKAAFEACDKTLQHIRGNMCLIGGVTLVMAVLVKKFTTKLLENVFTLEMSLFSGTPVLLYLIQNMAAQRSR